MDQQGYTWTRLDGSMNTRERNAVIAHFQDTSPDSPRVLLLSLRAGTDILLIIGTSQISLKIKGKLVRHYNNPFIFI